MKPVIRAMSNRRGSSSRLAVTAAAAIGAAAGLAEATWSTFSADTRNTGSTFSTKAPAVADLIRSRSVRAPAVVRDRGEVSIGWVGDTVLAPGAGRSLFGDVRDSLSAPDVTLANLEGTLSIGGAPTCVPVTGGCRAHQAPPALAHALGWAGVDVANLANDHSFDFGADGQTQTIAALRVAGVRHTGRPAQITLLRRRDVTIAVVGFAPHPWAPSLLDIPAAAGLVRAASAQADVVVAAMHAGAERPGDHHTPTGTESDRAQTRAFSHALVDAGADLVLGSGPQLLRGIEHYRQRVIAYSLGTFTRQHPAPTGSAALSGMLRVTLDRTGQPIRGRFLSFRLRAGRPTPDPERAAGKLVARVSRQDFGPTALRLPDAGLLELSE